MKLPLALFLSILPGLAGAATVTVEGSSVLRAALAEVKELLPMSYLDEVSGAITVRELALNTDLHFRAEDLCKIEEGVEFGFVRRRSITISKRLVELAATNTKTFGCGHGTFRKMLTAVLVHELTHVKDNAERISTDPDFQRIVGVKRVQGNPRRALLNRNDATSADPYEFKNLAESLAVNAEYLVLDPEFECRRPATANFLARRLGVPLRGECRKSYRVLSQSAFPEDNYSVSASIDPRRIYQVHYLFAGQGRAIMSRWGHAMFRLVVCAPSRPRVGPECLEDVSHHLALTYRANVTDPNLSYSRGVFGGYPSQLFVMRYLEVQQEYNKIELRDIFSVPLRLSRAELAEFVDVTLERYWTYQGRYYFLDNNCGTEAVKHLAVALPDAQSQLIGSVTPLKIYNDIIRNGRELSDESLGGLDRAGLREHGILVESMYPRLDETYQFLRPHLPSFSAASLERFLRTTTAVDRLRDYEAFAAATRALSPQLRKEAALRLSFFERYLAGRFLQELPKRALAKINRDEDLKREIEKLGDGLRLLTLQPWEVIDARYGVPTEDEVAAQFPRFLENRRAQVRTSTERQMGQLQTILDKPLFEAELAEIEALKKTRKLTAELIILVNQQ
jgi:hypothetical protein